MIGSALAPDEARSCELGRPDARFARAGYIQRRARRSGGADWYTEARRLLTADGHERDGSEGV
jgi:hypothetical protein